MRYFPILHLPSASSYLYGEWPSLGKDSVYARLYIFSKGTRLTESLVSDARTVLVFQKIYRLQGRERDNNSPMLDIKPLVKHDRHGQILVAHYRPDMIDSQAYCPYQGSLAFPSGSPSQIE